MKSKCNRFGFKKLINHVVVLSGNFSKLIIGIIVC